MAKILLAEDDDSLRGFLVNAIKRDGESNLLSTPSILTLNNREAEFLVGQNVPFPPVTVGAAREPDLAHPAFADAVERFLQREGDGIGQYLEHLSQRSPIKVTATSPDAPVPHNRE